MGETRGCLESPAGSGETGRGGGGGGGRCPAPADADRRGADRRRRGSGAGGTLASGETGCPLGPARSSGSPLICAGCNGQRGHLQRAGAGARPGRAVAGAHGGLRRRAHRGLPGARGGAAASGERRRAGRLGRDRARRGRAARPAGSTSAARPERPACTGARARRRPTRSTRPSGTTSTPVRGVELISRRVRRPAVRVPGPPHGRSWTCRSSSCPATTIPTSRATARAAAG